MEGLDALPRRNCVDVTFGHLTSHPFPSVRHQQPGGHVTPGSQFYLKRVETI